MDKLKFKSVFLHQETNTTRIKIQSFIAPENQHNYNPIWGFFWAQNQHNWSEGFFLVPENQHNYNQVWGLLFCTRESTQLQSNLRVFGRRNPNTTRIKIQGFFAPENQYNQNQNPGIFCTRKSILTEVKFEVWK
jgi:hypothetical protein